MISHDTTFFLTPSTVGFSTFPANLTLSGIIKVQPRFGKPWAIFRTD
jgi:hypothetical protein